MMLKAIPILMYHSLRPELFPNKMAITPELFRKQLEILKKYHFEVVSLEECARAGSKQKLLERKVAITFDDGYVDNFEDAFPLLKEFDCPATFFIRADTISQAGYMDWPMLKEIARTPGFEIGSHGLFHETLADVTSEKARESLRVSKRILETGLDTEIQSFSYPSGSFNERVMEYAKEAGYRYACAASRINDWSFEGNPYAIRRIKISSSSSSSLLFVFRLSGFYNLFRKA